MTTCLQCGKLFRQVLLYRFTCSSQCAAKHEVRVFQLRREWARMASGLTAYVLERDHWRCALCGEPIRARKGSRQPSVDHIVSLNRGGSNDLANLQAAHKGCNSVKGDRSGGQLLLFG